MSAYLGLLVLLDSLVQVARKETEGSHPMHCQELKAKREILGFQELQENLGHQDLMVVKVLKEKMVSLS